MTAYILISKITFQTLVELYSISSGLTCTDYNLIYRTTVTPNNTIYQNFYDNIHIKLQTSFSEIILCIFILVINQLDAQNFILQYVYFMSLHVSSTCAHHQEVKIVLYSLWYHQIFRWPSSLNLCTGRPPIGVMIPEAV